MYFPTPYPDELIGSVVTRASVHLGLAPQRLARVVLGRQTGQSHFFLPTDLRALSSLTQVSPEQLAMGHTVLPYLTAFMSPSQASAIHHKAIESSAGNSELAAFAKMVTQGSRFFRACPQCIHQDIANYGESYWRRSHLLPGVYVCPVHNAPLLEVPTLGTRRTYKTIGAGNPSLVGASPVPDLPDSSLLRQISTLSAKTLSTDWNRRTDWWLQYRELALLRGYGKVEKYVASSQLSKDLGSTFGAAFLRRLACPISAKLFTSWPFFMFKSGGSGSLAPLKHILLATFLASCPEHEKSRRVGKSLKSVDPALFDSAGDQSVRSVWTEATENETRLSVRELLEAGGVWSKFRNHRGKYPRIAATLNEFRHSEQASFQIGKASILHAPPSRTGNDSS